jgi:hypothetical protein
MRIRRGPVAAVLAAASVLLAACGSSTDPTTAQDESLQSGAPAHSSDGDGMQHIHGLGVQGNTLFIATHGGLWVAPDGQTKARRVGASQQDIMGFSVLSDGKFIGSGHPHPSQRNLPPNLGLIESRDGGETWTNISLLGEADFHVLESSGRRVYGFDGTQGRLMVSSDSGRSWQQRGPPAPVFDLAIDPADRDHVVAATQRGLFMSPNAGKGWRPLNEQFAGLLAWPRTAALYLVDAQGRTQVSRDGGSRWQLKGRLGGQPAALLATGSDLYAALDDASVKRSTDGGQSWTVRATP